MLELALLGYIVFGIYYPSAEEISHDYPIGASLNLISSMMLISNYTTPPRLEDEDYKMYSGSISYYDYKSMWEYTMPYVAEYGKNIYGEYESYIGYVDLEVKRFFNTGLHGFYLGGFVRAGKYKKYNDHNYEKNQFVGVGLSIGHTYHMGHDGRFFGWFGFKYGINLYQDITYTDFNFSESYSFTFNQLNNGGANFIDLEFFRIGMKL